MVRQALPKGVNPNFIKLVDGVYYDLCVVCRDVTSVRTDYSVEQRKYYVEGCGQLCDDCWHKTSTE